MSIFCWCTNSVFLVSKIGEVDHHSLDSHHRYFQVLHLLYVCLYDLLALSGLVFTVIRKSHLIQLVIDHLREFLSVHVVKCNIDVIAFLAEELVAYPATGDSQRSGAPTVFL